MPNKGDRMNFHYQIEILSPTRPTWQPYETLKESIDDLEAHLFCLRKAFPSFSVRVVDMASGNVLKLFNGDFAAE